MSWLCSPHPLLSGPSLSFPHIVPVLLSLNSAFNRLSSSWSIVLDESVHLLDSMYKTQSPAGPCKPLLSLANQIRGSSLSALALFLDWQWVPAGDLGFSCLRSVWYPMVPPASSRPDDDSTYVYLEFYGDTLSWWCCAYWLCVLGYTSLWENPGRLITAPSPLPPSFQNGDWVLCVAPQWLSSTARVESQLLWWPFHDPYSSGFCLHCSFPPAVLVSLGSLNPLQILSAGGWSRNPKCFSWHHTHIHYMDIPGGAWT